MYEMLKEIKQAVPDTHIMLNSIKNGDNVFASGDYMRNKDKLMDTGIDIYEYEGGTSYHGKTIVIDDNISIIGSYNLDLRSTYVDTELMLVIKSVGFTAQLCGELKQYEEKSRRIDTAEQYHTPQNPLMELETSKKLMCRFLGFLMQPFRYLV